MANFDTDNAKFNADLRKLEPTDPAHADTFNAGLEQLIKNDVALKKEQESSKISMTYDAENKVVRFFRGGNAS